MYREQSLIPSLLVMKCVNLGPQKTGGERVIHICITQIHKEEWNVIIELHECVCGRGKAMAPHSSTLAWEIPWAEEPGGLQSMGSLRVGYDWETSLSLFTFMHWRRKRQPTPVFLPGESQGREPGGMLSMGSHRVGHDWRDLAAAVCVCVCFGMCEENESGKAYIQTYFKDIFEGWLLSNKRWEEFDQREKFVNYLCHQCRLTICFYWIKVCIMSEPCLNVWSLNRLG